MHADAASCASPIIDEDSCALVSCITLAHRELFFFLAVSLRCVRISAEASCAAQGIETRSDVSLFVEEGSCTSLILSALFSAH